MEAKLKKMVESLIALVLVHFATLNHQRVDITCREDLISTTSMAISVSSPADFHVHLRQGNLTELTVPHVREGGFHLAYVMVCSRLGMQF